MTWTFLVVEDEVVAARRLRRLLEKLLEREPPQIFMAPTFSAAREVMQQQSLDVAFLDLNLNGEDGFQLLAEAVTRSFETIVVSANADRALEAFEYGVLDFVAKPYGEARLKKALDRFRNRPKDQLTQRLAFRVGGSVELVPLDQVIAVHGADNYAEVELRDGRRFLHDKGMDQLEYLLPEWFLRIHRSHLVNYREIKKIEARRGSRYLAVLANGTRVPISRNKIKSLRDKLLL